LDEERRPRLISRRSAAQCCGSSGIVQRQVWFNSIGKRKWNQELVSLNRQYWQLAPVLLSFNQRNRLSWVLPFSSEEHSLRLAFASGVNGTSVHPLFFMTEI
jgi:hypothetical protein